MTRADIEAEAARRWPHLGSCERMARRRAFVEGAEWAREAAFDDAVRAALRARFGPPSGWGSDRPDGWHLDRACGPAEAAYHDNGCVDAAKAIRALQSGDSA